MADPDIAELERYAQQVDASFDDLDKAILDLDRERLAPLLAESLPSLALMPDLDAVDFGRFSQLGRMRRDTDGVVFVPFSAVMRTGDGSVVVDPGMYPPEKLLAQADWNARWRQRAFEDNLRSCIERVWWTYYHDARATAMRRPEAASNVGSSLDDAAIARHLHAASRGLRQRGDKDFAELLESFATERLTTRRRGRPRVDDEFRRFLRVQLCMVLFYDGSLKFDRPTGTGSLVEFIDELRPLLPPGFVPSWKYPPSFVERLATQAKKEREARERAVSKALKTPFVEGLIHDLAQDLNSWKGPVGGAPHGLRRHIARHTLKPLLRCWRSRLRPLRGPRRALGTATAMPQT
jgi:hypothetical protein